MKITRYICLIICCCLLISCGDSETKRETEEHKTLIMGVTADYPPFEFIKNKKIVGFDIDLAHEIANLLGYKVYIKDMDFDALIPALHAGRVDFVLSGMTKTEDRAKNVDFSIPYYSPTLAVIYKKGAPIDNVQEFANKTFAVQLGSTMEDFLRNKSDSVKNINIISLTRTPTMIQELKLGRVDAVLIEAAQAKAFVQKNPQLDYSLIQDNDEGVAIAFPKDSDLIEKFNEAIIKLRDSGKLDKLKKKWLL